MLVWLSSRTPPASHKPTWKEQRQWRPKGKKCGLGTLTQAQRQVAFGWLRDLPLIDGDRPCGVG